jgi:hypothetical protein
VLKDLVPLWPGGLDKEPPDPTHFGVIVQVLIGTGDAEAADMFGCLACSPRWLVDRFAEEDPLAWFRSNWAITCADQAMFGAGLALMSTWSLSDLRAAIEEVCDQCTGPHWGAVASRLGRLLPWEYSYRYDRFIDQHPGETYPLDQSLTTGQPG